MTSIGDSTGDRTADRYDTFIIILMVVIVIVIILLSLYFLYLAYSKSRDSIEKNQKELNNTSRAICLSALNPDSNASGYIRDDPVIGDALLRACSNLI
jgi:flagellar basal body-associated protein FliL